MGEEGLRDFHAHTCHGDGVLTPVELLRTASAMGYETLAITEHCGIGSMKRLLTEIGQDCRLAHENWGIRAILGIEITHLPPKEIDGAARYAKELGAELVVVHGETVVEPVMPGTNLAAVASDNVDVLAHPGLLDEDVAGIAAKKGIFLEITSRRGHCLTNGIVVRRGREAGCPLIINSDAHMPGDLNDRAMQRATGLGAGLDEEELDIVLNDNAAKLITLIDSKNGAQG